MRRCGCLPNSSSPARLGTPSWARPIFLGHAGAVVLDNDGISAHWLWKRDGHPFRIGIPGIVNEFLQRPLGRGILLAQQCGEAGIHLETQMRAGHADSSFKAIRAELKAIRPDWRRLAAPAPLRVLQTRHPARATIPTPHSSASRNRGGIEPQSNRANPSRVGPSCRYSADQNPWQSAGH